MKASVVCPDGVGDGALSDARQRALRPQLRSCGEWPSSSSKMSVSPSHFEPTVISSFVGEIVFMRGSAVLDPDPCPVQSSKIDLYSLSPLRLVTNLRLYYSYTTPRPTYSRAVLAALCFRHRLVGALTSTEWGRPPPGQRRHSPVQDFL